jgi:lysophospholipase L1-like esterase
VSVRLVCLGDSFTEGMCDDSRADGQYTGWADRVAVALAERQAPTGDTVEYANLGVRGKLLDQVIAEQIPAAVSLSPTLLTFHAGPNDVLRRGTDFADLAGRYEGAVRSLAPVDAELVLFTAIGRAGGTGRVAAALADRFQRFNDVVRKTAADHGAVVVDLEAVPALTDRRLWHEDRLHLNPDGHRRVAAAVLEAIGATDPMLTGGSEGWWREPLPAASVQGRGADLAADLRWIRRHLVPWVGRRLRGVSSGDGRRPKDPLLRVVRPRS